MKLGRGLSVFEGITQRIQVFAMSGERLLKFGDFANVADRLEVLRIARAGLNLVDESFFETMENGFPFFRRNFCRKRGGKCMRWTRSYIMDNNHLSRELGSE